MPVRKTGATVKLEQKDKTFIMENPYVRVTVDVNGRLSSFYDKRNQ
jgi:hypothetical protein